MTDWLRDVRIGFRSLLAKPGFTVVAILTLGVGIGANTAIYSLVQAVILRPLPFPESERLVQIWETAERDHLELRSLSFPMLQGLSEAENVFAEVAGVFALPVNFSGLGGPDAPVRVRAAGVTASYFRALEVPIERGSFFADAERTAVVVLTTALWERRFASDPAVIGETVQINEVGATVVGIASGRGLMGDVELWFPLEAAPELLPRLRRSRFESRGARWLGAVGRLAPNVTRASLDAWMAGETARLQGDYPDVMERRGVLAVPLEEQLFGDVQQTTSLLMAAVGLVMLIACANLANLLLARGVQREREIALRFAVGATRWRIVRQLLAESFVLAALGGLVGLVPVYFSPGLLRGLGAFEQLPAYVQLDIDLQTVAFTAALCLVTALGFGIAPALSAVRGRLSGTMTGGRPTRALLAPGRGALVSAQVALALLLTVASGLLLKS